MTRPPTPPPDQLALFESPALALPVWPLPVGDDPQRVVGTGSRYLTDATLVGQVLTDLLRVYGALVLAQGECPTGGDWLIRQWADRQARDGFPVTVEPWPADWDSCADDCPIDRGAHRRARQPGDIWHPGEGPTYCPGAGPRRNAAMVAPGARVCVGFRQPGRFNSGTRSCMGLARHARIPTFGFDAGTTEVAEW